MGGPCVLTARCSSPTGGFLCHLLGAWQLRTIPPATESLNQRYGICHLFHLKTIESLPVRQHCGLGNQHVEVGIDAGVVPSLFELEVGLSRIDCLLFLLDLPAVLNVEVKQSLLELAERGRLERRPMEGVYVYFAWEAGGSGSNVCSGRLARPSGRWRSPPWGPGRRNSKLPSFCFTACWMSSSGVCMPD